MKYIKRYRKATDKYTTHTLVEPDYGTDHADRIVELCTLDDGYTYVAVPEGLKLPTQRKLIKAEAVDLSADLINSIKAVSPHVRLINERVVDRIRSRYSVDEELKMLRLAPSPESTEYNDFVEACREWGRGEKAALGL